MIRSHRLCGHSSNDERCAVFAFDPFGGFTTACPGLAGGGVAVFGSDFAGSFGSARFGGTATGENVLRSQAIFGHQFAHFGQGAGDFILAGLGNDHELALHLRATRNTGASEADVMEALLHVAIYAGVPRANNAIRIAKETFAAMAQEDAQ